MKALRTGQLSEYFATTPDTLGDLSASLFRLIKKSNQASPDEILGRLVDVMTLLGDTKVTAASYNNLAEHLLETGARLDPSHPDHARRMALLSEQQPAFFAHLREHRSAPDRVLPEVTKRRRLS